MMQSTVDYMEQKDPKALEALRENWNRFGQEDKIYYKKQEEWNIQ